MPRKIVEKKATSTKKDFHVEWLNVAQKMAWNAFQQHDVLFLIGPAGVGKSHIAVAFAIKQLLAKEVKKIVLTRPIVESGERLGYLPGDFEQKVNPYMMPLYDAMDKLVGSGHQKDKILQHVEVAPLAYMRGRSFHDAVCIFDEAQNASFMQLKLFLTRFCEGTKLIITGDPRQSDLSGPIALMEVVERLKEVPGIGVVEFKTNSIVRHPLVGKIIEQLEEPEDIRNEPVPTYGMRIKKPLPLS